VDKAAAPPFWISLFPYSSTPNPALHAPQESISRTLSLRANSGSSAPIIFLNCTKNTELTARPFARRVCFALNKKNNSKPADNKIGGNNPVRLEPEIGHQKLITENREPRIELRTGNMKAANQWITYRTRFLVQAKQLSTSLTFTDALGRQHSGSKGDYLVETSDGAFRIAPRQIFEDVYVPLLPKQAPHRLDTQAQTPAEQQSEFQHYRETPPVTLRKPGPTQQRDAEASLRLPPHLSRKSPQPDRNFPSPSQRSL
jgi:hypothetical protein